MTADKKDSDRELAERGRREHLARVLRRGPAVREEPGAYDEKTSGSTEDFDDSGYVDPDDGWLNDGTSTHEPNSCSRDQNYNPL
jgi:hypothetical protein